MKRLLATLVLALCAATPAAAAPSPVQRPTHAQAHAALAHVQALQGGRGVRTGYELSPALQRLYVSLPSLGAADRGAAEELLARPDDGQADPPDTHKWSAAAAATAQQICGGHFCIHWVKVSGDAPDLTDSDHNGVPDYVDQMLAILDTEVYPCENGAGPTDCSGGRPGLGWRAPAPDQGLGGSDLVDVYIEDLYANEHVYGYTAVDPGQSQDPTVPHHAYMVLDKDYSRYGADGGASGVGAERVTAAHEYNHVLQNAYDYLEDEWMFESTAVHVEDEVYPAVNDYLNYVSSWVGATAVPLTAGASGGLKEYGSAVWNDWLAHRFGPTVVRSAWERSPAAGDFAPDAYGAAIVAAGGGDFSNEFDRFAAAVSEWNVPGSGFPDPYPDVQRVGTLAVETQTSPFDLAHTTFALFDVPIPQGSPSVIRLTATLPAGTAGAVALMGRTGPDPAAGIVTSSLTPLPVGGVGAAQLDNPSQFGRITAVVVNSDPSHSTFDQQAGDYTYTRDAKGVVARVQQPGAPIPTTGPAALISDHGAFVNGTVDAHLVDTTWSIQYGRTVGYGSRTPAKPLPASTVGAAAIVAPLRGLRARTTYHYRVLASNSLGTSAGADMTFRTAPDVTKPKLFVTVKRQRVRSVRAHGLVYKLRCSERCAGTARLVLTRRTARRLHAPSVIGKRHVKLGVHARSTRLIVRLTSRARRRIAARTKGFRLSLDLSLSDDSHNRVTLHRRVSLR